MKKLFLGLLTVIAIVVVVGLLLPSHARLSESIVINAPANTIFEELSNFKEWKNWSPWQKKDPNAITTYEGPDAGVGCKMNWDSKDPKVGKGFQEIIQSIPNKHIEVALSFAGWDHTTRANWDLKEQAENSTQVTWSYSSQIGNNILHKYMSIMINPSLKKDYIQGLQQLKAHIEQKMTATNMNS